jgi:hypothetical protein
VLGVPASAWIGQIRPDSLAGVVGDAAVGCGGYSLSLGIGWRHWFGGAEFVYG